jgi:hypothetical protein
MERVRGENTPIGVMQRSPGLPGPAGLTWVTKRGNGQP